MVRLRSARLVAAGLAALIALTVAGVALAAPFGTAFTYQGQLRLAGVPVNGTCDLTFALFDAAVGGTQIGATQAATGVTLVDGRFTVQLDFGATAFTGEARWLQIATRCPSGSGGFTALDPRQPLTPTPYAIFSQSATSFTGNLAGDVTGTQGATIVARLQGRDVVNTAPLDGQVLKFNAGLNRWEPSALAQETGYLFAYSTVDTNLDGSFRTVNLTAVGPANDWALVSGADTTLTAAKSGLYLVQYTALVYANIPGSRASLRFTRNGTEITGSQTSGDVDAAGSTENVSNSFLFQGSAGDVLRFEAATSTPSFIVTFGFGDTPTSASVTIVRLR
jgi:hypothetical protein